MRRHGYTFGVGTVDGFTLIELAVTMFLLFVLAMLTLPAIGNMITRSKLEGAARETGAAFRQARQEAIRRSVPVVVAPDTAGRVLVVFADVDGDRVLDPPAGSPLDDDAQIGTWELPAPVSFGGPGSGADARPVVGFTGDSALFRPDGSVAEQGAVRLRDDRGNFLEVRVASAAAARIVLRKWRPDSSPEGGAWRTSGEGGEALQWQS
jgi:type II secretory pathway pseudopilin PulG